MKQFTYYQHKQDSTYLVRLNSTGVAESFTFADPEMGVKSTWMPCAGVPENFDANFIKVGIRQLPSCARNASVKNITFSA